MRIEEVDKLVEPLGWERDLCHDGNCFPELNKSTQGHEGSYKKFNMTEHGEDGYISYESLDDIIESVKPKLKIPKDIAKQLDSINASEYESLVDNFIESYYDYSLSEKLTDFSSKKLSNYILCIVYLSGKELGERLVEVVEE